MRTSTKRLLKVTAVMVVPALVIGMCVADRVHNRQPAHILGHGRLAPLPASATEVRSSSWTGFLGTFEEYLAFSAPSGDIDAFIQQSAGLRGVEPKLFDESHMYLPLGALDEIPTVDAIKHEYFQKCSSFPRWYDPTIRTKGRVFEGPLGDCVGWVTVNDAAGTVYVHVAD